MGLCTKVCFNWDDETGGILTLSGLSGYLYYPSGKNSNVSGFKFNDYDGFILIFELKEHKKRT
jgi:hypothetical protein